MRRQHHFPKPDSVKAPARFAIRFFYEQNMPLALEKYALAAI
jgi:hypothetical protein